MPSVQEKIRNKNFEKAALKEWEELDLTQRRYISYLLHLRETTGKTFDNPSASNLLYALGITNEKPERSVSRSGGGGLCDIDNDFSQARRDEVVQYAAEKYGFDKVAKIGTFGTYKAKKAIRAAAKTLGHPLSVAERICKLYPPPKHGQPVKFSDALEESEELKKMLNASGAEAEILYWASQMEDRIASFGVHASGVVVSDIPLSELVPLARGRSGELTTQWDMNNVEERGLIKFDFLGLKTLTMMDKCLEYINLRHGIDIDLDSIPIDDDKVYSNLRKGDNVGVFQLETSNGMRDLLVKIRPETLEDLAALVAIFRPGPLDSDKLPEYLEVRAGRAVPRYAHPDLEPILKNTAGWIIYQESVLHIARDLAGFTLAEADLLRRAVGKKKKKEMEENEQKFIQGCVNNGYEESLGRQLWEEIKAFAAYGFNKSHAVAYALISYQSAWLKTHYPVEFIAAALSSETNKDQIITYLGEAKKMGIDVMPPDINSSQSDFFPTSDTTITFGFSAVKNFGEAPAGHVEEVRNLRKFQDFFDFTNRVDLSLINKKVLDAAVYSGMFDFTGKTRATLLQAIADVLEHKKLTRNYLKKKETYENKLEAVEQRKLDIETGVLSPSGKRLRPLKPPVAPEEPKKPVYIEIPELPKNELILMEKQLTGFFITGHPLDEFKGKIDSTGITISKLRTYKPHRIKLVCIFNEFKTLNTRKNQPMAFAKLEDLTGTADGVIFPTVYKKTRNILIPNVPVIIDAEVEYTEGDPDEDSTEDEVIPSLKISNIRPLVSKVETKEELSFILPLDSKKIEQAEKVLTKFTGEENRVRIRFRTDDGAILAPTKKFSINEHVQEFKSQMYKAIQL